MSKLAVVGAGWAGCAAAVQATDDGHRVSLFEASHVAGGRARALPGPGDRAMGLDNGQHILIGAYTDTLALMQRVGADASRLLLRLPLSLRFPDGTGLGLPDWPAPLDALAGIVMAHGWNWADRWSLIRVALRWRRDGFACATGQTVDDVCQGLTRRVREGLIDLLCVSALNTPAASASGAVFLRVLRDSLFGARGSSQLLLPRADLGQLFPLPALQWLRQHGAQVELGHAVHQIARVADGWEIDGQVFDAVALATPPWETVRLLEQQPLPVQDWLAHTRALRYEAITTVYLQASIRLAQPMLVLRSTPDAPAQFVFDRGQLGGPAGLLALVVSASQGDRATLQAQVGEQARMQLGLTELQAVRTIIEKRATFACTPGLVRPTQQILPGLLACGDYVDGPYPSTLEGAVRSGRQAAGRLGLA